MLTDDNVDCKCIVIIKAKCGRNEFYIMTDLTNDLKDAWYNGVPLKFTTNSTINQTHDYTHLQNHCWVKKDSYANIVAP